MKKYIIFSALVTLLVSAVTGESFAGETASALVRTRLSRDLTLNNLNSMNIDVLAVYRDGRVDLAVTDRQLEWVTARTSLVTVLERVSLKGASVIDENLGLYHTYLEMEAKLDSLALEYPDLTRIDTLGTTIEGRIIRAIKISDNPAIDEPEPEVLIMGCLHARELMSVEVPLMLAEYLLDNYGSSPELTELVDEREIWIAPMINPDGHVYVQNNHSGNWWTWWRKNRRDNGDGTFGVDLNRNFGYKWGYDDIGSSPDTDAWTYRGTGPFSEPETQTVRDFCNSREFVTALSYHSYSELIIYPWGYDAVYTDDHELFSVLADSLKRGNDYHPGCTATDVLYSVNGDSDDWMYGATLVRDKIFGFTIELNSYEDGGFAPPEELIQPTFDKVLQLNLTIIRRAENPHGVLGPHVPVMYEVADLADPSHMLSWSQGNSGDPNPPISYEVVEYTDLEGITDPCETGDTLWVADGFSLSGTRAYSASSSFYSGSGDDLNNSLEMCTFYPMLFGNTLTCMLWFDIELDWDYAYLEVSLDDGLIWQTVPGNRTTNYNPNGNNHGNGITGNSVGWRSAAFYLDQVEGVTGNSVMRVRFSYNTDGAVIEEGIYIDDIDPVSVYGERNIVASTCPDTFMVIEAEETGEYAYLVKAADSEGHYSRFSNIVFHTVTDVTDAGETPAYHSGLGTNYPNPFNPTTTISFTVGNRGQDPSGRTHVLMELYDISGRRIAGLVDKLMSAGQYLITWNGKNSNGAPVASGVYFIRLETGEQRFTRKIILLR